MKKNTLLVVFIIVALLATTAFAKIDKGKLGILLPTTPGNTSEVLPIDKKELKALRAGETTVGELMLAKANGIVDTMKVPYGYTVRFGASPGDTMGMYFKPPAALIVKAIGMNLADIDADAECHVINLSLVKSNYHADTHPADSIDAAGWLGAFIGGAWQQSSFGMYPLQWEAGHFPLWGEFPVTITETHVHTWTDMIYLGFEPDVGRDDFVAVMVPVGAAGSTIRWEGGDATAYPNYWGLKSYAGAGTSGNPGWHVRSYGWNVWAVVEYYENTPPNAVAHTYGSVLSADARTLECDVKDVDADDPAQAGAATVVLKYKVNDGAWVDVSCAITSGTDTDGTWGGEVPAGTLTPGDVLTYYFIATDKAGLSKESIENSYGYFVKTADVLIYYNDDASAISVGSYVKQVAADVYDVWDTNRDGISTPALVDPYQYIVRIDGYRPHFDDIDAFHTWLASGTEAAPKCVFWSSQEVLGSETDWEDTEWPAGDWHNDLLGVGGVQNDLSYIAAGKVEQPFIPINAVMGDMISGNLAQVCADSAWQLYHDVDYEMGGTDWADGLTLGVDAVACFTDSATGVPMGVHKGTATTKAVFLALDQLAINTHGPGTQSYWWPEHGYPFYDLKASLIVPTLEWFGALTDVENNGAPGVAIKYDLSQNYPNPFNPETKISYSVEKAGQVKLAVYNVLGQKVADLVNEFKAANTYKVNFDASNFTSGVYFYRLEVGDYSKTMKMMLLQ